MRMYALQRALTGGRSSVASSCSRERKIARRKRREKEKPREDERRMRLEFEIDCLSRNNNDNKQKYPYQMNYGLVCKTSSMFTVAAILCLGGFDAPLRVLALVQSCLYLAKFLSSFDETIARSYEVINVGMSLIISCKEERITHDRCRSTRRFRIPRQLALSLSGLEKGRRTMVVVQLTRDSHHENIALVSLSR